MQITIKLPSEFYKKMKLGKVTKATKYSESTNCNSVAIVIDCLKIPAYLNPPAHSVPTMENNGAGCIANLRMWVRALLWCVDLSRKSHHDVGGGGCGECNMQGTAAAATKVHC